MDKTLKQLEEEMNGIAGEWNGEDHGRLEERAGNALEVIEKIKDISDLLDELNR